MKFYDGLNEDDDNSESEDTETESSDGESKDQSSDSPKYPTVVMHCGAQNGFGGNTEDYAFCVYSEDDGEYILGGITTELDLEDLDEDDDMYFYYAVTTRIILVGQFTHNRDVTSHRGCIPIFSLPDHQIYCAI